MHSIRAQILAGSLALVAIVLLAVVLFSTRATTATLEEVRTVSGAAPSTPHVTSAAAAAALAPFARTSDWVRAGAALEAVQPAGTELVIVDATEHIAAGTAPQLSGASVRNERGRVIIEKTLARGDANASVVHIDLPAQATSRTSIGGATPHAYVLAFPRPRTRVMQSSNVAGALNRKIWLSAALAILAASLLSTIFSGYIVTPLRAMTAGVARMASHDFEARVSVRGPSEVRVLAGAFNDMAQRLNAAEAARRDLISDVAHELRTPINNLQGQLEALADGLAQPTPGRIAALHDETLRLGSMVADLQQLSLADAGQLSLSLQPLPPCEFLTTTIRGIDGLILGKRISVQTDCDPELPMMHADPEKLRHVILNVLTNAVRHSPEGGLIAVRVDAAAQVIRFRITDAGPGFEVGDLGRVFERFFRADRSRSRESGGSGLGLAIAKRFVEAHGGTISAQNAAGGGAEITFSVPQYRDA